MASFIRGKQTGIQNDLSAQITPESFVPDDNARYGINSQISCLAYDPIQSLLAIGTAETSFGAGQIYVFGHNRVAHVFVPPHRSSIRTLHISGTRLVSIDSRNELVLWDLTSLTRLSASIVSGSVACSLADPALDWVFLGLHNGDVTAYDLDTERVARQFRLPHFWQEKLDPRHKRLSPVVALALHPRDVGQLLIGYREGAVIYSFKQAKPTKYLEYVVPAGAPGGDGATNTHMSRKPALTHAIWHPSGTFVMTAHEDGSMVFWDTKEAKVLMARTITETRVDQPRKDASSPIGATRNTLSPFSSIAWCGKENPDDTGILIAGGHNDDSPTGGLTFIELGPTPMYATSSWQTLQDHFGGKRHSGLPLPRGARLRSFCLIPRESPHLAGSHDPIAVVALLDSGELLTLSFPSGYPISPTNQFPPSVSFVHPYAAHFAVASVTPDRWVTMTETRDRGNPILKGGGYTLKPRKRLVERTIIQVAHGDATIRIWDVGHNDEIENGETLQLDVARAVGRTDNVKVSAMSLAGGSREFAVGTSAGEMVLYRWENNMYYGMDNHSQAALGEPEAGGLVDISHRAEPSLRLGLVPSVLYKMSQSAITAVKTSNIGFVAVGSQEGRLSIVDNRGPKVILQGSLSDLVREKRSSFLRHSSSTPVAGKEWAVVIAFGVLTLDGESYSSIACFVGTNAGRVITFKLLPGSGGSGYSASAVGGTSCGDKIIAICPIVAETGMEADANSATAAGLANGEKVNGLLVVVTQTEVRIFKPASAKGASKSFDHAGCCAAAVSEFEGRGHALVCVFDDQTVRVFSLPALKELSCTPARMLEPSRIAASAVTRAGDVVGWTAPSELAILGVWGSGKKLLPGGQDTLANPELVIPARPTISGLQWIAGTQFISTEDLDLLIGGPDRPPSKRALEHEAVGSRGGRADGRSAGAGTGPEVGEEGWGDYLTRQLNERTERLNVLQDNMGSLASSSQQFANDVNKYVNKQKRGLVKSAITSKFS